jgi:hypothetical protein
VILLKTKEKKRDVNMQRKNSDNNNNNNSRKTRKEGGEKASQKKKDWNFFPHLSMCTGKITEIRRSSVLW